MHRIGKYSGTDRMSDLVCDNYHLLLVMSRFGIALGFGDHSIEEVCHQSGVDTRTFLAVVNLICDEDHATADYEEISLDTFLNYLHSSHGYFLEYRLPDIRRKLVAAPSCGRADVEKAILQFYDTYADEVRKHMTYEEEVVFPYVRKLLDNACNTEDYNIETFHRRHDQIEAKLAELKNILIKYYPATDTLNQELYGALFDIFLCEAELTSHNELENRLFIPAVAQLEKRIGR
jgi:regulator of cell morphogenesis and NO signaling